jgi:uncharacterized membrane protein YgcG
VTDHCRAALAELTRQQALLPSLPSSSLDSSSSSSSSSSSASSASTASVASLSRFLAWFASYETLFSAPCTGCARLLSLADDERRLLPPTLRSLPGNCGGGGGGGDGGGGGGKGGGLPFHVRCFDALRAVAKADAAY